MSPLLANALIWHVLLGLLGIIAFVGFSLLTAKREWNTKWLRIYSLTGTLAFLISWISGGYYYSAYYGKTVKPLILAGSYPWIHKVIMETKEHIFLFLPFLAFVAFIVVTGGKEKFKNEKLRQAITGLCLLVITLGLAITLSGIAISGAVTKRP